MHIVHIASELAPLAKVGGLGDVIHSLSKEFVRLGAKVEIIIPRYDCIDFSKVKNLHVEKKELVISEGKHKINNTIWKGTFDGLDILFIDPHHPKDYFNQGTIYGSSDDAAKFIYFSKAALEYLLQTKKNPDILHVHDWISALIPVLIKEMYAPLGLKIKGTVLTIHNMEHQGKCTPFHLTQAGLKGDSFLKPEKMQDPLLPELINLLKGGIEYADIITTVSPNYEQEIKTPQGGFSLDKLLLEHQNKLHGILNGIDIETWNPEKDPYLVANFSSKNIEKKQDNKKQLRTHFQLKEGNFPIVASVTRLARQKGPHLIKHAILRTLEKGGQFVLLASGSKDEMKEFIELKDALKENKNVGICLDNDEMLAHLIYAGADMFIIPSIFEPCGLTQMLSLRYGTIPIARRTGGLADTVFDIDTSEKPQHERNGFTFDFPDAEGVNWALDRAINFFNNHPKKWQNLIHLGMKQDFSWVSSAKQYLNLYKEL